MIVRTKKYQLESKIYRKVGLRQILRQQWWIGASIFFGIILLNLLLNLVWSNTIIFYFAPIGLLFFYLFWLIQFAGAPQLEQMKPMFEKMSYEISGKEILMKKSAREGMQMKWPMIKKAEKKKDAFILFFSKVQFIYLPFKIFKSENDIRLMETILKRKELL